ncbi:MAG: Hsp20/alpha crystallin family protein [Saprospiraceae bacterium]|jgi:HSP20 family protein|nr:Hsp20/alpha crystallin family protein [Saprospiraceae bacterium]
MLVRKRVHRPASAISQIFDTFLNEDIMNFPTKVNHRKSSIPAVNIKESDEGFNLELAAPGLGKEDFKLELENDILTISAEKKVEKETAEENENKTEKYTRREFSFQSFKRTFTLPETVDISNINANYENGVLLVNLPKKEEAKPQPARLIEIA